MANLTALQGLCPGPFLQESLFPPTGGYTTGRFCTELPGIAEGQSCCIPCPISDWTYPDNFYDMTRISGYISCVSLGLCVYMLITFVALPAKYTKRHYLNICLICSAICFHLGFVVPMADQPPQCFNAITPNGERSNWACAWGGSLLVFGGVATNMWILIRALSIHLQICWNVVPGNWSYWAFQAAGWAVSTTLLVTSLVLSGFSARFGDYCMVNYENSLATLWGPLLGFAGISASLQLSTLIYCLQVYLRNAFGHASMDSEASAGQNSTFSLGSQQTRAVFIRMRKVLILQWRALAIAVLLVADVIFFSVVFVVVDARTQTSTADPGKVLPWITCLVEQRDKNKCLSLAAPLVISPTLLIATLILLSLVGIECFVLISRRGMFTGWYTITAAWVKRRRERSEFTSIDARQRAPRIVHVHNEQLEMDRVLGSKARKPRSIDLVTPLTRIEKTDYWRDHLAR